MNRRAGFGRLLAPFVALATLAAAAQPAVASLPTPASGGTWAQNQLVEYRWKEGAEPPAWAKAAMNAAAYDSHASSKAKAAIFAQRDASSSWLAYTDDLPTSWAIGYTVRSVNAFSIRLRPHGTQLDWGTLRWCQFYDDPPNGCYDAEMVTLHEFGHAQTLDHVDEANIDSYTDSVMHASGLHSKAKLGWNMHDFGRCDVARLQIRYEALTPTTPYSTCLELPTDLALSTSASSVGYNAAVTFTARLKVADDAAYASLASDPIAGRSVVLQRRLPGSSTWSSVLEIPALANDAGRYVKTLSLTATYEWRATFASPPGEGLDGSSSAIVKITVTGACPTSAAVAQQQPRSPTC
jgi:hypothetical protein